MIITNKKQIKYIRRGTKIGVLLFLVLSVVFMGLSAKNLYFSNLELIESGEFLSNVDVGYNLTRRELSVQMDAKFNNSGYFDITHKGSFILATCNFTINTTLGHISKIFNLSTYIDPFTIPAGELSEIHISAKTNFSINITEWLDSFELSELVNHTSIEANTIFEVLRIYYQFVFEFFVIEVKTFGVISNMTMGAR